MPAEKMRSSRRAFFGVGCSQSLPWNTSTIWNITCIHPFLTRTGRISPGDSIHTLPGSGLSPFDSGGKGRLLKRLRQLRRGTKVLRTMTVRLMLISGSLSLYYESRGAEVTGGRFAGCQVRVADGRQEGFLVG